MAFLVVGRRGGRSRGRRRALPVPAPRRCGRSSVVPGDPEVEALVADADVVIESFVPSTFDPQPWLDAHPGLIVCSITPVRSHRSVRRATDHEFIVQAESGGLVGRGSVRSVPFQAGGRTSEWLAGTFSAMAVAAAARRAQRDSGLGDHIDFSIAEVMTIAASSYAEYMPRARRQPADRRRAAHDRDAVDRADPRRLRRLLHQQPSAVPQLPAAHRPPRPHRRRPVEPARPTGRRAGTSGTTSSTRGRRSTPPPRSCASPASCASRWPRCTAARTSSSATSSSPATCSSTTRHELVQDAAPSVAHGRRGPAAAARRRRASVSTPVRSNRTRVPRRSPLGGLRAALGRCAGARPHRLVGRPDRRGRARRARGRRDPRRVGEPHRRHARRPAR